MGSRQFGSRCRCGNGHNEISEGINPTDLEQYDLADLETYKVIGIQFGTNPLVDSIVIGENQGDPKSDNYVPPTVIGAHKGLPGLIADIIGFGSNNCVHCFCFLEIEELAQKDEGIIIEFGEYYYNDPNDFKVKTYYISKKGGLRLYVVKRKWFENYCLLARIKFTINKKEILGNILHGGITSNYKWRLEFYDRDKQNCHDFAVVLLKYLEIQNFEIVKGSKDYIPDKILRILNNNNNNNNNRV